MPASSTLVRVAFTFGILASAACGDVNDVVDPDAAAPTPDAPPPPVDAATPAGTPKSCAAIHRGNPQLPSGLYTIDPDGEGPAAAFQVTCDMETADGGWTIVFLPMTLDYTADDIDYTSATTALLAGATDALLAYRDASSASLPGYALFPLPAKWKLKAPFAYAGEDEPVQVRIDRAAPVAATLRYGNQNFDADCNGAWDPSFAFHHGRICVKGTKAPFFNAFSLPMRTDYPTDACTDSSAAWSARFCTAALRFSIAVR